jgi:hypothetical protein
MRLVCEFWVSLQNIIDFLDAVNIVRVDLRLTRKALIDLAN